MFAMLVGHLPAWLNWTIDREQSRRANFLARSPLFAGLPRRQLGRLATRFLEKAYNPGDVVFLEGDPGRALFVLVEGTVEITQATARGEHVVRSLGVGDAFGELALIDDAGRSGTARVVLPARLLILYKTDFDALIEGEAKIAVVVMRNLSRVLASYARRSPVVLTDPTKPGTAERS